MARLAFLAQLLLVAATACVQVSAAATSRSRRSGALDLSGPKIELDSRDQLSSDIYNERGELVENAHIVITERDEQPNNSSGLDRRAKQKKSKKRQNGFDYGKTKVRGVNIGGWLVLEPWITPSVFEATGDDRAVDEWTLCTYVDDCGDRLEAHFNSFYKQSDFYDIANAGLNHVRIPIGYWALDKGSSPFYKGSQYSKLKAAVGWARNAGLRVMVDLHGAPGSQNGFDNSGHRGVVHWFNSESYKSRAKEVIRRFAADFRDDADVVTAIELLNEPLTTSGPSNALSFYQDYVNNGYYAARYPSGSTETSAAVVVHDGFQPLSTFDGMLQEPTYHNVLLDTHIYSVFNTDQVSYSQKDRMQFYCNMRDSITSSNQNLYTVVGEFTAATTDCAKYLNGRGIGARYDGSYPNSFYVGSCKGKTGKGSSFSSAYKAQLKQSWDTQRKVYEHGSGWLAWTWTVENAADWSYKAGLKYGWITKDLNNFEAAAC